jgi:hypothetical protein
VRSAWNSLLAHAHAVRITLLVVLIVGGTVWGWYLWKNGGFSENPPPTPQFMELYIDGGAQNAAVSVTSAVTPVTAFGKAGKPCSIESAGCNDATEYLRVQVSPQQAIKPGVTPIPVGWMLVVDTPPADHAHTWTKAHVSQSKKVQLKAQFTGFPSSGVWIHTGEIDNGKPVTFQDQFDVHLVARPSDHLVIEMPALLSEANPQSWCGPETELDLSYKPPHLTPDALGSGCALAPGQSAFPIASVLPFTGPIDYFAPKTATSTEVLVDSSALRGFTLDSSDGAAPIASGFDWTGTYQVEPAIYATNISSTGLIARRQLILGILIGLVLAALLGLVGEFRHEKKELQHAASDSNSGSGPE